MLIYFYIAAVTAIFSIIAEYFKAKNKIICWLCLLFIVMIYCYFAGARADSVGTDTAGYGIEAYNVAKVSSFDYFFNVGQYSPWAPLAKLLMWSSAQIGDTSFWYFWAIEAVTVIPVIIAIYLSCDKGMGIAFAVFSLVFYPMSFNAMRQMMAMGFLLLGWQLMREKGSPVWFFAMLIVGYLFHDSALLAVLVYPICKISEHKGMALSIKLFAMVAIMGVMLILIRPILSIFATLGFYSSYITGSSVVQGAGPRTIIEFIGAFGVIGFFTAIFSPGIKNQQKPEEGMQQLILIVLFGVLAFSISAISLWLYRFGLLYIYYAILLVPKLVNSIKGKVERTAIAILCSVVFVAFSFDYYGVCLNNEVVPYLFANRLF